MRKSVLDDYPGDGDGIPKPSPDIDNKVFSCHYTDAGNAQALALIYGSYIRYVHGIGWHVWEGNNWIPDAEDKVFRAVTNLSKYRLTLVIKMEEDKDKRKEKIGEAMKLENKWCATSCLKIAESRPELSCVPDDLDKDPMFLACPNGTVALEHGLLVDSDPADLITHVTGVRFEENAQAPRWQQFLKEVFVHPDGKPDLELIRYIQRAVGYSLTGKTTERSIFICIGQGANGKSTFLNTVHYVIGSYAGLIPFSSLMQKPGSDYGNDIAALRGKRFVSAIETDQMQYMNESKIKRLTGGDPIQCRFLFKEYFAYFPTYKLWLACNHKPKIRGTDQAIWDRVKVVPFNNRFVKGSAQTDKDLVEKLKKEGPGILAWMVDGARQWVEKGLGDCQQVEDAIKDYRTEEDVFQEFLDDAVVKSPGAFTSVLEVWQKYNDWAKTNGHPEMSNTTAMGIEMKQRGYVKAMKSNQRGYSDISLMSW